MISGRKFALANRKTHQASMQVMQGGGESLGAAGRSLLRTAKIRWNMTSSLLRYIMAIDALAAESERVRSVDLAESLGVARASVCKALDRLTEGGYAVRGGGGQLRLTAKGNEVVRNYAPALRLVKSMFADKLGVPEQRADRESLAVLGVLGEDTVQRIARLYGGGEERK